MRTLGKFAIAETFALVLDCPGTSAPIATPHERAELTSTPENLSKSESLPSSVSPSTSIAPDLPPPLHSSAGAPSAPSSSPGFSPFPFERSRRTRRRKVLGQSSKGVGGGEGSYARRVGLWGSRGESGGDGGSTGGRLVVSSRCGRRAVGGAGEEGCIAGGERSGERSR